MKSLFFCGFLPFAIQSIYATPATINQRQVAETACVVDQLTPAGEHISHNGNCGTVTDVNTMALRSPTCVGNTKCIVPRTDCSHPGGGKCVYWTESCSIGTYTLGKDDEVCPQNLRCCEGTISTFEDTTRIPSNPTPNKPWNEWGHHDNNNNCNCGDTTTTAQAKIINSHPNAKATAARAVKKILHKVDHKGGSYHAPNDNDYNGEHEELLAIWKQFLHLLETPEGGTPQIVTKV